MEEIQKASCFREIFQEDQVDHDPRGSGEIRSVN